MVAPLVNINNTAVLVAAIVSMVIGGLWYSPLLFGNLWMKLNKVSMGKKKSMGKIYLAQFITLWVMIYVLAHYVAYANATTVSEGILAGFWAWLGFIATMSFGAVLWQGKSFKAWLLDNAHNLLVLAISGAIIAVWA